MKYNYQYDLIIVSTEKMNLINRLTHEKVKGEITLHKAFNQTQVTVNEGRHAYRLVPGYINGIRQITFDDTTKEQDTMEQTKEISKELYDKLEMLGIIDTSNVRENNVGQSNYAEHTIQPWSIWLDYKDLTPWDADIIKRILRTKDDKSMTPEQQRTMDYNKIIHICQERIRQIQLKENQNKDKKKYIVKYSI